ncbi:hypothetical protein Tco_0119302, partial [Tanacetum coccineum]
MKQKLSCPVSCMCAFSEDQRLEDKSESKLHETNLPWFFKVIGFREDQLMNDSGIFIEDVRRLGKEAKKRKRASCNWAGMHYVGCTIYSGLGRQKRRR